MSYRNKRKEPCAVCERMVPAGAGTWDKGLVYCADHSAKEGVDTIAVSERGGTVAFDPASFLGQEKFRLYTQTLGNLARFVRGQDVS